MKPFFAQELLGPLGDGFQEFGRGIKVEEGEENLEFSRSGSQQTLFQPSLTQCLASTAQTCNQTRRSPTSLPMRTKAHSC